MAYSMNKYCKEIESCCRYKNVPSETQEAVFEVELSIDDIKELAAFIKDFVLELEENRRCKKCDYKNRH